MWTAEAWDSYVFWQGQDKKTLKRINRHSSERAANAAAKKLNGAR
jgi:hypothetical protein